MSSVCPSICLWCCALSCECWCHEVANQCFHLQPIRLLQRYSEWSAAVHHCTSSAGTKRSCMSRPWLVPERTCVLPWRSCTGCQWCTESSSRVHRILEKSLKVLEFLKKKSRPLKVLENRVGPWKSLKSSWIWMFHMLKFLRIKILKKTFL